MWLLQLIVMKLDIKMKGNNLTDKNHFGDHTGTAANLSDFKVVRGNRVLHLQRKNYMCISFT